MRSERFVVRVPGKEDLRLFSREVAIQTAEIELELLIALEAGEEDLGEVSVLRVDLDGSTVAVARARKVESRWGIEQCRSEVPASAASGD